MSLIPDYETVTFESGIQAIKRLNQDGSISFIPMDYSNADYQQYLKDIGN